MGKRAVPINFENAKIMFKNFEGREGRYNRKGDRNFVIVFDDVETARKLKDDGWNIRFTEPREEGDKPFMSLQVAVSFRSFPSIPPAEIFVYTKRARRRLTEDTVAELDFMEIGNVDLTIRPRFWLDDTGNEHVKAYLKEMHVTPVESPWSDKYAEYESPSEIPFD